METATQTAIPKRVQELMNFAEAAGLDVTVTTDERIADFTMVTIFADSNLGRHASHMNIGMMFYAHTNRTSVGTTLFERWADQEDITFNKAKAVVRHWSTNKTLGLN